MENLSESTKGNNANTLLCAVKLLVKDSTFWWNLIPAITNSMFILFERNALSYICGCIGMLNWFVVIEMFVKSLKH
jgi:hypothetical protein